MTTSLQDIKTKISQSAELTPEHRQELGELVERLGKELESLSGSDRELAQSVCEFACVSTREVIRSNGNEETLGYALKGFSSSVDALEVSHPKLVDVVNRICKMLADIGI